MQAGALAARLDYMKPDTMMAANAHGGIADSDLSAPKPEFDWFLLPYGDYTKLRGSSEVKGMQSISGGLMGGFECERGDGLTFGVHAALTARHFRLEGGEGRVNSSGGFIGAQVRYQPADFGGFYLNGMLKAGVYENRSRRQVSVGSYSRRARGSYVSYESGVMAGGGYDFRFGTTDIGPFAYAEYTLMHHGSFREKGGDAVNLKVSSATYDSLQLAAGVHAATLFLADPDYSIISELTLALRQELLDRGYETRAAFLDYDSYSFKSHSDTGGRTAFAGQYSLGFNHQNGLFGELTAGFEVRQDARLFNAGIRIGLQF